MRRSERSRAHVALAAFCVLTLLFIVPRDLFVPHVRDVEVWAGFELRGAAAWGTAPLHWALFAFGAWAAWREKPWILSAAAAYAFYIAASHVVWNLVSELGDGVWMGLVQGVLFSIPAIVLAWADRRWKRARADESGS